MEDTKIAAQYFATVTDMHALPAEKIDHFCEDLRLWLHMHRQIDEIQAQLGDSVKLAMTTPTDRFGWIDDNRHDARITIDHKGLSEQPGTGGAVDPGFGVTTE